MTYIPEKNITLTKSYNNDVTTITAATPGTKYALIGIKLQAGATNVFLNIIKSVVKSAANKDIIWEIWQNPTVSGTFAYSNVSNSSAQVAVGDGTNTLTVTSANLLDSGYISGTDVNNNFYGTIEKIGVGIDKNEDEIVLSATPITANADTYGALTWVEL